MKRAFSTVIAAILSGLYWFVFFLFAETWTAGDYRAGSEPSEIFTNAKIAGVLVCGPIIFALLIYLWRKIETAIIDKG